MTTKPTTLPILVDMEKSIIGGILLRPDALAQIDWLETEHFGTWPARIAFAAMRELEAARKPIDVLTVEHEIARQGKLDAIGGASFIGDCAISVPTVDNVIAYAQMVRDAWLNRTVRLALSAVISSDETNGAELLSMALAAVSKLDTEIPDDAKSMLEVVKGRLKQLDKIAADRAAGKSTLTGAPTGIAELDAKLGGWQFGIASIVAARPAMGKSSLALATADASSEADYGAHLFSLEDSEQAYADRGLSRMSSVPAVDMRSARLNRMQMGDIVRSVPKFQRRPWLVDTRSGISADEIVRSVRKHRKSNKTRVVIVDYIQLLKRPCGASAHEALSESITILADAAKQDDMAYVVLSQLNRDVEKRHDKRPLMSDLRESGSLEERAKCVVGIYRGDYYSPGRPIAGIDYPQDEQPPSPQEFARQVQLLVLKNNNGPTGEVLATFDGPTTTMR